MKISIVIPCYNVGQYLTRCIESVLSQTYSHFEVILIDDGSTDSTAAISQSFAALDNRVQYFYQENSGVSVARNLGIEKASGTKIMFLDADDYITSTKVSDLVLALPNDNQKLLSICGLYHVKKGVTTKNSGFSRLIALQKSQINKNEILTLFEYENLSSPCCKLYDLELLHQYQIRFHASITYQEDLLFNLDYFKQVESIIIVPSFHYYYIEHPTSSSIKYHKQLFAALPIIYDQLKSYPDFKNREDYVKRFFLFQILNNLNNTHHSDSGMTLKEQYRSVRQILNSDIYEFCQSALKTNSVHFLLKFLITFKCYSGIVLFYKSYRILK
ncbi:glycosyltransferase family 2 protein [Flavobacterium sp. UBA7663]|uniref:glycosyltransferase family 2 protein n=1 Tax=Flavobacterium sp. UBA7663 TaxID=1946557 RepID=UPI0025C2F9BD|nr:glycosyltransferase family 2 protein [Flavobacterium sp. UBA7663]